jgi:hypothetical protein
VVCLFFNLAHDRQRPWCAESLRAVPFSSTMEEDHAPRRRRPCTPSCFSERYRHPAAVVEEHNHRVKQMPAAPMHPDSSPSCSLWLLRSPPPCCRATGEEPVRVPLLVLTVYSIFTVLRIPSSPSAGATRRTAAACLHCRRAHAGAALSDSASACHA